MHVPTTTAATVPPGTAEALAQLAYLGTQHHPRSTAARAVDDLAFHFIGDVGTGERLRDLWENLREDCMHLWWVQAGQWSDDDVDELTEADEKLLFPHAQAELAYRVQATRDRLTGEIEQAIAGARVVAAEARRSARAERVSA